jgi:putative cell wall-binding protein
MIIICVLLVSILVDNKQTFAHGNSIVDEAEKYVGVRYSFGGTSPSTGFDCSGYTQYIYKQFNITIPRTTSQQWNFGKSIDRNSLKPGDIVFFSNTYKAGISHDGIYIGNNEFIHASSSGVRITSLNNSYWGPKYTGARRVLDSLPRIYGANRFDTAVEISKAGWNSTDTVFIARADDFPDALAGAPLAYKLNAPILLTERGKLVDITKKEIVRLHASKAIILGGNGAVGLEVETTLKEMGLSVERIAGKSRYETAAKIAERLGTNPGKAVIAYGGNFPDALAIAPYAAQQGYPILLTAKSSLPSETLSALNSIAETIVVGGEGVISQGVFGQLPNASRISGESRYDTAANIILQLGGAGQSAYVATGQNFADALTGAVLAAKQNKPLLLVRKDILPEDTANLVKQKGIQNFTILGGDGAVSDIVSTHLK